MENQETKHKKKSNDNPCCATGCGCCTVVILLAILSMSFWYHYFGENEPKAPWFNAEKGKNFSYDITYSHQFCEFEISEVDFLDFCNENTWKPVEIETLPSLPESDWDIVPRINYMREIPLSIERYCYKKPEHKNCDPWMPITPKCQVDPTGKTDESCFHTVDNGYYYECRFGNGGGIYVLFDRENNRCYIHANAR